MQLRLVSVLSIVAVMTGGACGDSASDSSRVSEGFQVSGYVHAGPTCPVMQDPPDPECDDRAVADAVLVIEDASGTEIASVRTGADGTFAVSLSTGSYSLVPQPVEGLLGTAEPRDFEIVDGPVTDIDLAYDTGIR